MLRDSSADVYFSSTKNKICGTPLEHSEVFYNSRARACDPDNPNMGQAIYMDRGLRSQHTSNQRLAGPANPKTLISPVVVPPIFVDEWKTTAFVKHSHINDKVVFDGYRSGYVSTIGEIGGYCDPNNTTDYFRDDTQVIPAGLSELGEVVRKKKYPNNTNDPNGEYQGGLHGGYSKNTHRNLGNITPSRPQDKDLIEGFTLDTHSQVNSKINTSGGYNSEYTYPNAPKQKCDRSRSLVDYDNQLHTNIIQPGVYSTNEIIEPNNHFMGISHQQQFQPTEYVTKGNTTMITQKDPIQWKTVHKPKKDHGPVEHNVYDPRFTGYGSNKRMYIDNMTGQPRFYYDDIDASRMPNYIVRSKIDHLREAAQYGSYGDQLGVDTKNIRNVAQQSFLNATNQHRVDMQQRLMRKINARNAERRKYPKHTTGLFGAL